MSFYCPTRIVESEKFSECLQFCNLSGRVLILSSPTAAEKSGALDQIVSSLNNHNVSYEYANSVHPNPTVQMIDCIFTDHARSNIKTIISVGGGSVIDTGKILSLCFSNNISCSEILNSKRKKFSRGIHIAVPTTCGTGSETSKGAIITDYNRKWKGGVRGDHIYPSIAYLNPNYLKSLNAETALLTGFDAVSHAVETFMSEAANSFSKNCSIGALELLVPNLLQLKSQMDMKMLNFEQLSALSQGSCLAGISLANSTTCLPHRLQYCVGALTDSVHAEGVSLFYPQWLDLLEKKNLSKLQDLYVFFQQYIKVDRRESPILRFMETIGVIKNYLDVGLTHDMKEELVGLASGTLHLDPCYEGKNTIREIFDGVFRCRQ